MRRAGLGHRSSRCGLDRMSNCTRLPSRRGGGGSRRLPNKIAARPRTQRRGPKPTPPRRRARSTGAAASKRCAKAPPWPGAVAAKGEQLLSSVGEPLHILDAPSAFGTLQLRLSTWTHGITSLTCLLAPPCSPETAMKREGLTGANAQATEEPPTSTSHPKAVRPSAPKELEGVLPRTPKEQIATTHGGSPLFRHGRGSRSASRLRKV